MPPSTDWREVIPADEETRFADYAKRIGALQKAASARLQASGESSHSCTNVRSDLIPDP
jgi:hypothetical protein